MSTDSETRFKAALRRVARLGIEELEVEFKIFVAEAKAAYREVYYKLEAAIAKEQAEAEEMEDDGE
jgi:hypothetical protein